MSFHEKNFLKEENVRLFLSGILGGIFGAIATFALIFVAGHFMWLKFQPLFLEGSGDTAKPLTFVPLFSSPKETSKSKNTPINAQPSDKSLDVSELVAKVNPAVVSIVITKDVPIMEQYYVNPFGENSPFGNFRVPKYRQNGTQQKEVGGGSGFLISADGYVISNAHVVQDQNAKYTVFLNGGKKYDATVIARDSVLDIALLKIDAQDLPYLAFGNSDGLKLGQSVVAIGNALGEFRNTISTGIVSGLARSITAQDGRSAENLDNLIQTDAAINPGNSGGPLLNAFGEVIGVNVAIAQGSQNVGFALPSNMIKQSVESMKTNGRVIRPFLGIRYIPITPDLQKQNHLSVDYGVLVVRGDAQTDFAVIPGSPANKAGIAEYDIVLEADGKKIDKDHLLSTLIRQKKVGDQLKLKILHGGLEKEVIVTLEEAK